MFSESTGSGGEQDQKVGLPAPRRPPLHNIPGVFGRAEARPHFAGIRCVETSARTRTARFVPERVMFENSTVCHAIYVVVLVCAMPACVLVWVSWVFRQVK